MKYRENEEREGRRMDGSYIAKLNGEGANILINATIDDDP